MKSASSGLYWQPCNRKLLCCCLPHLISDFDIIYFSRTNYLFKLILVIINEGQIHRIGTILLNLETSTYIKHCNCKWFDSIYSLIFFLVLALTYIPGWKWVFDQCHLPCSVSSIMFALLSNCLLFEWNSSFIGCHMLPFLSL